MNSVERVDEIRRRVSAASPPSWAAFWEGRDHSAWMNRTLLTRGRGPAMSSESAL